MRQSRASLVCGLLLTFAAVSSAQAQPEYLAREISTFPGGMPRDLNDLRQILIWPGTTNEAPSVWDYAKDSLYLLPGFDSIYAPGPVRINNNGEVVGRVYINAGERFFGMYWDGANFVQLGTLAPAVLPQSQGDIAFDISDNGVIVGQIWRRDFGYPYGPRAGTWTTGGAASFLMPLPGYVDSTLGKATAVNSQGDICGDMSTGLIGRPAPRAVIWQGGVPIDLGVPDSGFGTSNASDINDSGWVVGSVDVTINGTGDYRAYRWKSGQWSFFTFPDPDPREQSWAHSINNANQIVGYFEQATGSRAGFLWENDTAYVLKDLIVNPDSFMSLMEAIDINRHGDILAKTSTGGTFLLERIKPDSLIVNSTGDAVDESPGDGRCFTGGLNSVGEDECTLRAAIMEANAKAGPDTIRFDIPGPGVPVIQPDSALPLVFDEVFIDGTTQPVEGLVEIDGSQILDTSLAAGFAPINGLEILSSDSRIEALAINGFTGHGLTLKTGSRNLIRKCFFGTDRNGDSLSGNGGDGIRIALSDSNAIGDGFTANANVIAYNGGAGVFVESGEFNLIRSNGIHSNGGLGIDLSPAGVNANDSADTDGGANKRQNFPVLDSVFRAPLQTTLHGHIDGEPFAVHFVEVFVSDTCDSSGHGEGQTPVWSTTANGGATGWAPFSTSFSRLLDSGEVFTLTATDQDGNTSEFSACWPNKILQLRDDSLDLIVNEWFELYAVEDDQPTWTDSLIDTVMTDDSGKVDISDYLRFGELNVGERFRLQRKLHSEPSVKHPAQLPTAFSIYLDNVKFDSLGHLDIEIIDTSTHQLVLMDHTTIAFNLLVSIEWNAGLDYIGSTQQGFRNMSNYLYDVTDGQMRLDTVAIYDDKDEWDAADFQVHASNVLWPHVDKVGGLFRPQGESSDPVEMPRKWFGTDSTGRNQSAVESPLDMAAPIDYRTRAHEFAHFALNLYDEYKGSSGAVTCNQPPRSGEPLGMLQSQYIASGRYASELSTASAYTDASCQNTLQWQKGKGSCWDVVDKKWTRIRAGILSPILQPDERTLAGGRDYLVGPNDNLASLDYDVGALVEFPVADVPPGTISLFVRLADSTGKPMPNARLTMTDTSLSYGDNFFIEQGRTSDSGRITVMGFRVQYAMDYFGRLTVLGGGLAASAAARDAWVFGQATHDPASGDSVSLVTKAVQGDHPFILSADLDATSATLSLHMPVPFDSVPGITYAPSDSPSVAYSFVPAASGYDVTVPDSLRSSGWFNIQAKDDSNQAFSVPAPFEVTELDSLQDREARGPGGDAELEVDTANTSVQRVLIVRSPYPVVRNGLDVAARQLGDAHAIGLQPAGPLVGDNYLTLRYPDGDLPNDTAAFTSEESARMFHWNEGLAAWELVGGSVDTTHNEVLGQIQEDGVYALFTTSSLTGLNDGDDGGVRPDRFELQQNYPNPFNASTVIAYSLDEPAFVRVTIYNVLGRTVRVLDEGAKTAGRYELTWDGKGRSGAVVASGLYFYKVEAGDKQAVKKMLLLK